MDKDLERFDLAAAILPDRLRMAVLSLPEDTRRHTREFRLRAGQPLAVLLPEGEIFLDADVGANDLETLCDLATEFSRYASAEAIRCGYLTVRGGFRVGLCGTAVMKDGEATNLRDLSSAAVRISREQIGIADKLAGQLIRDGRFCSTLIYSPPGGGKTTFLRDLVRSFSDGTWGGGAKRISVIDERSELAVCFRGRPQLNVGCHTDILDGCPKAKGIPMVLRAMNPEIIAVDEITVQEDIDAMAQACGCGVGLLATIHASSVWEIQHKPLYRSLLQAGLFQQAIGIRIQNGQHCYELEELPCPESSAVC